MDIKKSKYIRINPVCTKAHKRLILKDTCMWNLTCQYRFVEKKRKRNLSVVPPRLPDRSELKSRSRLPNWSSASRKAPWSLDYVVKAEQKSRSIRFSVPHARITVNLYGVGNDMNLGIKVSCCLTGRFKNQLQVKHSKYLRYRTHKQIPEESAGKKGNDWWVHQLVHQREFEE